MNKIQLILGVVFVVFATLFIFPVQSHALDADIACNDSGCTPGVLPALFPSSEIWFPGKILSKTVRFRNNSSFLQIIGTRAQNTTTTGNLDQVLQLSIVRVGAAPPNSVVWSDKLSNFYSAGEIHLATFSSGFYDDFIFTVSMDQSADNKYQDKKTVFDLIIGFIEVPSPTPTSTTTFGAVTGGGGPGVSAAGCNDTPPSSAPILTSAIAGVNSVTLFWTQAGDPVSYYLIAYGTSPGVYSFGNPNIGGKGTTSYTVAGLTGGVTYYFVVRAGNGCSPGPFSNELSSTPTGGFITGLPAGFLPGVLGVSSATPTSQLSPLPPKKGKILEVKGIESRLCTSCIWWPILLGEAIALLVYYFRLFKKYHSKIKRPVVIGGAVAVLAYLIFLWLNRNCNVNLIFVRSDSFFCRYFWLLDALVFAIITGAWKKQNPKL